MLYFIISRSLKNKTMKLSMRFIIYFLIIANEVEILWSRPIAVKRKKRQVVQPKWLSGPDSIFVDPNVHVTDENLKEAAAIRDAIQKAINAGTFAVNVDQPNAPIPTAERSKPVTPKKQKPARPQIPKFEMPQFELPQFDFTQFNLSDFELPEFDLPKLDPDEWEFEELFEPKQREHFLKQIHHLWDRFWEASRKVLSQFQS